MIIRPTPWFLATAAGGSNAGEITVGTVSISGFTFYGYISSRSASTIGGGPTGSFTHPEFMDVLLWLPSESPSVMSTFLSRTNTKRFTFTAYSQSVDTSDFADGSSFYPALAPVWSNEAPYDMGASLPTTVGAKVAYLVSDIP